MESGLYCVDVPSYRNVDMQYILELCCNSCSNSSAPSEAKRTRHPAFLEYKALIRSDCSVKSLTKGIDLILDI